MLTSSKLCSVSKLSAKLRDITLNISGDIHDTQSIMALIMQSGKNGNQTNITVAIITVSYINDLSPISTSNSTMRRLAAVVWRGSIRVSIQKGCYHHYSVEV